MFRRLLLPLAATALLAGCVTSAPYGYRGGGQGDYYYGSPSVEYRYEGYPGYGDPYYGPYRSGFSIWGSTGGYYGRPYYGPGYGYPGYGYPGYGNPYYGNPYYGSYYGYPHPTRRPRPDQDNDNDHDDQPSNQPSGGPWRNLDEITRRRRMVDSTGGGNAPQPLIPQPQPMPQFTPPRPMPRMDDGGSPVGQVIRRGRRANQQDE